MNSDPRPRSAPKNYTPDVNVAQTPPRRAAGAGTRSAPTLERITGFPRRTIYQWIGQLAETGDLKQKSRSGRPKCLSPKKQRHLGLLAQTRKQATSSEIAESLNATYPELNIAPRTVRENLQKLGYQVAIPYTTPFIPEAAKAHRISWAESHQRQKWGKVVFSDETTFQMFSNKTQVRFKGERPSRGVVKHPFKVHVWGAFCARGTIGFHMFTENMNGDLYREILTENLFEQAQQVLGKSWIFQQDNDPKHTAKLTKALLQKKCPKVLDWPAYSPDLNPIENIWAIMKRKVEKRINKLLGAKKSITKEVFMEIIATEWGNIGSDMCLNLVKSMPKRLELVTEKAGRKIKY